MCAFAASSASPSPAAVICACCCSCGLAQARGGLLGVAGGGLQSHRPSRFTTPRAEQRRLRRHRDHQLVESRTQPAQLAARRSYLRRRARHALLARRVGDVRTRARFLRARAVHGVGGAANPASPRQGRGRHPTPCAPRRRAPPRARLHRRADAVPQRGGRARVRETRVRRSGALVLGELHRVFLVDRGEASGRSRLLLRLGRSRRGGAGRTDRADASRRLRPRRRRRRPAAASPGSCCRRGGGAAARVRVERRRPSGRVRFRLGGDARAVAPKRPASSGRRAAVPCSRSTTHDAMVFFPTARCSSPLRGDGQAARRRVAAQDARRRVCHRAFSDRAKKPRLQRLQRFSRDDLEGPLSRVREDARGGRGVRRRVRRCRSRREEDIARDVGVFVPRARARGAPHGAPARAPDGGTHVFAEDDDLTRATATTATTRSWARRLGRASREGRPRPRRARRDRRRARSSPPREATGWTTSATCTRRCAGSEAPSSPSGRPATKPSGRRRDADVVATPTRSEAPPARSAALADRLVLATPRSRAPPSATRGRDSTRARRRPRGRRRAPRSPSVALAGPARGDVPSLGALATSARTVSSPGKRVSSSRSPRGDFCRRTRARRDP